MSEKPKSQRTNLIVNPRFQWTFVAMILQLEAVVFVTAVLLALVVDHLLLDMSLIPMPHSLGIAAVAVALFLLCSGLLVLLAVRTSNRVSGPLHRVSAVLEEIAQGRIPDPIAFRERDFHPELADKVNSALAALRERSGH